MSALSANISGGRDSIPRPKKTAIEVENSEIVYHGALASVRDLGNGTAANQGRLGAYTGAAGEVLAGVALGIRDPNVSDTSGDYTFDGAVTGDTSADTPPKAGIDIQGQILKSVTVTGASAISDQYRPVFLSSDNDFTLTPQARVDAVGFVARWHTSTTCDVYILPPDVQFARCTVERIWLSQVAKTLSGTSGNLITGYPMPFKGLVLALGYEVSTAITGSSYDTVLNAELGGTNVTGGTIALADAAAGTFAVGSSFATANHVFSRGTVLDIEIAAGTAADAGAAFLFIDVLRLPGS